MAAETFESLIREAAENLRVAYVQRHEDERLVRNASQDLWKMHGETDLNLAQMRAEHGASTPLLSPLLRKTQLDPDFLVHTYGATKVQGYEDLGTGRLLELTKPGGEFSRVIAGPAASATAHPEAVKRLHDALTNAAPSVAKVNDARTHLQDLCAVAKQAGYEMNAQEIDQAAHYAVSQGHTLRFEQTLKQLTDKAASSVEGSLPAITRKQLRTDMEELATNREALRAAPIIEEAAEIAPVAAKTGGIAGFLNRFRFGRKAIEAMPVTEPLKISELGLESLPPVPEEMPATVVMEPAELARPAMSPERFAALKAEERRVDAAGRHMRGADRAAARALERAEAMAKPGANVFEDPSYAAAQAEQSALHAAEELPVAAVAAEATPAARVLRKPNPITAWRAQMEGLGEPVNFNPTAPQATSLYLADHKPPSLPKEISVSRAPVTAPAPVAAPVVAAPVVQEVTEVAHVAEEVAARPGFGARLLASIQKLNPFRPMELPKTIALQSGPIPQEVINRARGRLSNAPHLPFTEAKMNPYLPVDHYDGYKAMEAVAGGNLAHSDLRVKDAPELVAGFKPRAVPPSWDRVPTAKEIEAAGQRPFEFMPAEKYGPPEMFGPPTPEHLKTSAAASETVAEASAEAVAEVAEEAAKPRGFMGRMADRAKAMFTRKPKVVAEAAVEQAVATSAADIEAQIARDVAHMPRGAEHGGRNGVVIAGTLAAVGGAAWLLSSGGKHQQRENQRRLDAALAPDQVSL